MANALKVMAKRHGLWPGAHDEHIARAKTALKVAVEQHAIDQAPHAEDNGDQPHGNQHNAARNVFGMHQIERAGKQQSRGEAGLHAAALLAENIIEAERRVEVQSPADHDQSHCESAQKNQQDSHRAAMDQRAAQKSLCTRHRPRVLPVKGSGERACNDSHRVQRHPEVGLATRPANRIHRRFFCPSRRK